MSGRLLRDARVELASAAANTLDAMLYHVRMGLAVIREDYRRRCTPRHTKQPSRTQTGVDLWAENGTHYWRNPQQSRDKRWKSSRKERF